MIRIENPFAVAALLVVLVVGVGVLPFVKTDRFRITRWKVAALLIAFGYCVYLGSAVPLLIFLWPLSFIWFPEYWGRFTGRIRGPYIDENSPRAVVSAFGWFFLLPLPVLVVWIAKL